MPGRRKRFDCGHLGRGRECHRCAAEAAARAARAAVKAQRTERLAAVPIDLSGVPPVVAEKAVAVWGELQRGKSHTEFRGKRLAQSGARDIVSIPLGKRWRMLCEEQAQGLGCIAVCSHETYNTLLSRRTWAS